MALHAWQGIDGKAWNSSSLGIGQAIANCVGHEVGSLVDSKSFHDVGAMSGNGVEAQTQVDCDFAVRLALSDELHYLTFARGQGSILIGTVLPSLSQNFIGKNQLAGNDPTYRGHELDVFGVLYEVASSARLKGANDMPLIGVHAHNQDGGLRRRRNEGGCGE